MAPSATWTTCPYVNRDGRVNPDVRSLPAPGLSNQASAAIITNALAYALTGASQYATVAANYLEAFYFSPTTGMLPRLTYAQVIRGPPRGKAKTKTKKKGKEKAASYQDVGNITEDDGSMKGSFMGIIDFRGITKAANAVQILRQGRADDWTYDRDQAMVSWSTEYLKWLLTSDLGLRAKSAKNNHVTFYYNQVVAMQLVTGDLEGGRESLNTYFAGPYREQIDANGEQPLEAARTRPFHYRAFNIEGLIVLCKLADQLSLDAWTFRTSAGATVQTAVDYTMTLSTSTQEAQSSAKELAPHVAAMMAVFGDQEGKYQAWLDATWPTYLNKAWWLGNQRNAFAMSPLTLASGVTGVGMGAVRDARRDVMDVIGH